MKLPKLPAGGVKTLMTRAAGRTKLVLCKNAPGLMTYGGIAVVGFGIYLFCRATLNLEEKVDEHDQALEEIEKMTDLTEREAAKERFDENRRFAWEMVKLYGPAVTTTGCGFVLILGGHHIIKKRNAALGAAYKILEDGYSRYRQRVREDLGEEKDREYLYGLKKDQMKVLERDENGGYKEVEKAVYIPGNRQPSVYARFFDECSTQWTKNPEYNLMFLNAQQNYANDKLHAQGHLFLNEVYESLGFPHTQAGSVVGWVLNKGGDNCVDFGIYDLHDELKRAFVNGYEPAILLDFNVQGTIYDLI